MGPARGGTGERRSSRVAARVALGLALASVVPIATAAAASLSVSSKTLTVLKTCTLTAASNASAAEFDSMVDQNSATTNANATVPMDVQSSNGKNRRIYVRFDLTKCNPAIPSSASVTSATLRLYVTTLAGVCRTEDVFRVTASWADNTITWNNQPFGSTANNPSNTTRTDAQTVGTGACTYSTANSYVGFTVTADVAAFVAGTATNYGWMIRDDAENSGTARTNKYSGEETNLAAQGPQLVINYV